MHRVSWKWPLGCLKKIVICNFPLFCFPLPVIEKLFSSLRVKLMDWHLLMSTSDLYRRLLPRAGIAPSALGTSGWSARSAHVSLCSSGLWAMGGESREGAGAARSPATTGHVASNPWRGACLLRPCAGTGKSRLGGCSSLPGSQPLCKESLEVCMGYTRGTSSPPLSQPVSFSLSLRVIKGSYFRDTSSTTSLSTESIANHSPHPPLCSGPLAALCLAVPPPSTFLPQISPPPPLLSIFAQLPPSEHGLPNALPELATPILHPGTYRLPGFIWFSQARVSPNPLCIFLV